MISSLDPAEWFRRLHTAGVDYVIIGGFAVIAHGVVRATKDLDVCPAPSRSNLARLAGLLREVNARQIGMDEFPLDPTNADDLARGGNFLIDTDIGRLDIMQWVPGIHDEHAYADLMSGAVVGEAFGVQIRVASLADLRRMKRAAGRPRDLADLADLADAHGEDPDDPDQG